MHRGPAPGLRPARRRGRISATFGDGGSDCGGPGARPSVRGAAASGAEGSILGAARAATAARARRRRHSGDDRPQPRPARSSPPMPPGGNFGGRPESLRNHARAPALSPAVPRQVVRIGPRRAKTLGDSATAETPRVRNEREPPPRHALCTCSHSGTRNGQTPAGACVGSLHWKPACVLETWPRRRESGRSLMG